MGWEQKNKTTRQSRDFRVGLASSTLDKDDAEQEAWLISPLLSKAKAQSMHRTFRLRYELPTQDGQEQFGVYLLTPDGAGGAAQFLDITKSLLVPHMEPDRWYINM